MTTLLAATFALIGIPAIGSAVPGKPNPLQQAPTFQFKNQIEIGFCTEFDWIWNDSGSGSDRDGGYWWPRPGEGFHALGALGLSDHGDPNGNHAVLVVRDISGSKERPALKPPLEYTWIWNDAGSGADSDVAFWQPVPPEGYVAMGTVATNGAQPPVDMVRCVRADLVQPAEVGSLTWNDTGSGADREFSSWTIKVAASSPGEISASPGTFVAWQNGGKPERHESAYSLRLSASEFLAPGSTEFQSPRLTGFEAPSGFERMERTYIIRLPWFAVTDPQLSDAQKLAQSPVYHLVRTDKYKLLQHYHNDTSVEQTHEEEVTTGFSESATESFSKTTGIELTGKYEHGGELWGGKVSCELKLSQSFTWGSSTSKEVHGQTTTKLPMKVPPHTASAMFAVESSYKLIRNEGRGSQAGTVVTGSSPRSIFITSFPREDR